MFSAKMKSDVLKSIIDVASPLVNEATFNISSKGISLKAVDPAHVAMIDLVGKPEAFDEFKADGRLEIREFELESPDIPVPVLINRTEMNFSPEFVELADFDASIGSSDISLKGKLENFLPFVFEDGTIIGSLDLSSQLLDLNELMPADTLEKEVVEEDSVVLSVIEVPANVDFTLQSSLKKVHYDNMDIENLYGLILVKDQKVILQDLNLDILKGKIAVSGEYNTQDIKSPIVELSLDVQKIDIPSAFTTFVTPGSLIFLIPASRRPDLVNLIILVGSLISPVIEFFTKYSIITF